MLTPKVNLNQRRIFPMKPLSLAPKFNQVLTVCALGVTLLGLPMATVAQDATSNSSGNVEALHSSKKKIYVDHTKWMVEPANNGRKHDYFPEPWVFMPDGTVRSAHLWRGTWHKQSHDTISVRIHMRDHSQDHFIVKFKNPFKFTAYKNGHAYRYGVR